MTPLDHLNAQPEPEARKALERCCGATRWIGPMVTRRPFLNEVAVYEAALEIWSQLEREDILEAFRHHPRIGNLEGLRKKFTTTATWASGEQAGVRQAPEAVLERLAEGNRLYEEKFGHIFIVCATGRSADEMLAILEGRLPNDPEQELRIAAEEQAKITRIRLEKLLTP